MANRDLGHIPRIIVLCGPTAVGKTRVSIELAKYFNTEIVSADSRQFYRELNAAVGKPTREELEAVRHHFINHLSIFQEYSAGKFQEEAWALLPKLFRNYKNVVAVGGSGLYLKAMTEGLADFPVVPPSVKLAVLEDLNTKGLNYLLLELAEKDPEYYAVVDRHNSRRVCRAIEVIRTSGVPFSHWKKGARPLPFLAEIVPIKLSLDRQELYEKINQRVEGFIQAGLKEEAVQWLPYRHLKALQTLGYPEMFDFLEGKADWLTTVEKIKQHNRNYAKRQETWLKKYVQGPTFHPGDTDGILQYLAMRG